MHNHDLLVILGTKGFLIAGEDFITLTGKANIKLAIFTLNTKQIIKEASILHSIVLLTKMCMIFSLMRFIQLIF